MRRTIGFYHALKTDNVETLAVSFSIECINVRNHLGHTLLYDACSHEAPKCIRWLLENGADVEAGHDQDPAEVITPLLAAIQDGRSYECIRILLSVGRAKVSFDAMVEAVHQDKREITRLLLSYGGSVCIWSPLSLPAWWTELLQSRERCRRIAVVLIGVRRLRQSAVLASNGMDAIRLVAMQVWQTQLFENWVK
jgi:hypothetical protein